MSTHYGTYFNTKSTPQTQPIPNKTQVVNNAGGYVFELDKWDALDRFLILGTDSGTYYVNARDHTIQASTSIINLIKEDGIRVVNRVVEVSDQGLAHKNDPALFILAMCSAAEELLVRKAALSALPKVARIGTHLFHFVSFVEGFRGWGRALRRAVANWYLEMDNDKLAYQVLKYKQRDGWSHRDLLRLAHPKTDDPVKAAIFQWVVSGTINRQTPEILIGNIQDSLEYLLDAIKTMNYPREAIPTEYLNETKVWEAMLPRMPYTATLRNLGKMSSMGMLKDLIPSGKVASDKIRQVANRVHPMSILLAAKTYDQGHGFKGSLSWSPSKTISNALDDAFYTAFQSVEPTGKNIMLALDVSGSMGSMISGSNISCREASVAMALITEAVEDNTMVVGFTSNGGYSYMRQSKSNPDDALTVLDVSSRQRLPDAVRKVSNLRFGGTDCAQPMLYALKHGLEVDAFVVYTDNETWHGSVHPVQALQEYRCKTGINAKLVVVGMTATNFTIADPSDAGMLDVVGFDASAPQVIANFIRD